MKKIVLIISVVLFLAACEKYTIDDPQINSFTASKTDIKVGDTVVFKFNCDAQHGVIWCGDKYPIKPMKPSSYDAYQSSLANPYPNKRAFNSQSDTLHQGVSLTNVQLQGKDSMTYIYNDKYNKYKNLDKIKVILILSNIGDYGNESKNTQQEIFLTIHK